ncbi:MAG: hypothetical protein QOG50_3414 [Actinomycetota bacterium]|jgi:hypothetical protein|nr:hypothetical protein [Actinomycetota bacterium]
MPSPTPRPGRIQALYARDAGLRRVSIVTRVAIVASVAAAGAFTAVAAWAQPGRSKTAVTTNPRLGGTRLTPATVPPTTSSSAEVPGSTTPTTLAPAATGGDAGGGGIAPPDTAPTPGYSYGPAVVSGAS